MRVAMVAGEASGDLLGAELLRSLHSEHPGIEALGVAGPKMQAQGCRSLYPMERLSVNGLFESFGRYPELVPARARLIRTCSSEWMRRTSTFGSPRGYVRPASAPFIM